MSNAPTPDVPQPASTAADDLDVLYSMGELIDGTDIEDIVEEVLSRGECLDIDEIVDAARREGCDLGEDAEDEILAVLDSGDRPYLRLVDDRWVSIPALLTGRTLTHRLTSGEADHDILAVVPDLVLVQLLAEYPDVGHLADGGKLRFAYSGSPSEGAGREIPDDAFGELGSLVLPVGTLRDQGLRAGDLVGLRYDEDGFDVVPVPEPAPDDTRADLLRDHVLSIVEGDRPMEVDDVIAFTLSEVPVAFHEPLPPITELFHAWDLTYDDGMVAAPGFDLGDWYRRRAEEFIGAGLGLSPAETLATRLFVAILSAAEEQVETDPGGFAPGAVPSLPPTFLVDDSLLAAATPDRVTRSLAEPAVAYAILEQFPLGTRRRAAALAAVCERLEPRVARPGRVGLHWLWAKALEELGDTRAALTHLRAAERQDAEWPPVIVDLARYAADRGDAATGLALLSRLEDDAAPLLRSVLEQLQGPPSPSTPRNAPCWCGSGRKFKQCHLRAGRERPLTERAEWPYIKALAYAMETTWRSMLEAFTAIRTAHAPSGPDADSRAGDALVLDVALYEGTVFAEYVARQGWLLPADELLLAQQWLLVERSVYEVTDVDPGVGARLRDIRTGDHVEVVDRKLSHDLHPGLLICTRLLPGPDGAPLPLRGLEPVRPEDLDGLLELLDDGADPERLIAYLSRRFAPGDGPTESARMAR